MVAMAWGGDRCDCRRAVIRLIFDIKKCIVGVKNT